jgi:hypothetical protein
LCAWTFWGAQEGHCGDVDVSGYSGWVINNLLEGGPPGAVMGFTEKGYMQEELFRQYIEHFVKSIPPTRPTLLMLDGHSSHINLCCIELCRENNILLYALPSNTTHILQPSEIPFQKLKDEYDRASERYHNSNNGAFVTKQTFTKVIGEAYLKTYTPQAITNSFKATGTWPVNRAIIPSERLEPSLVTEQSEPITASQLPATTNSMDTSTTSLSGLNVPIIRATCLTQSQLENETLRHENMELKSRNKELEEENKVLKYPGSAHPRQAIKYLVPLVKLTDKNNNNEHRCSHMQLYWWMMKQKIYLLEWRRGYSAEKRGPYKKAK